MIFSKALLAKGLGGLAMVGTGSLGIISTKVYLDNKLTRFDQGLIDFLEAEGKIKFAVRDTTSSTNEKDLGDSFPAFSSSSEQKATVTIKVKINGSGGDDATNGKLSNGSENSKPEGKKENLKKLNKTASDSNGTDWTWICELKFIREGDSGTELKEKDKLVKSSDGFFDKLKAEEENKELKQAFIRNCAGERGFKKNWEISKEERLSNNEIKSTKEFKLKAGGSESKLEFENQSEFENWFNNPKSSN